MKFVCYSSWDQLPESANALFEQTDNHSIFLSRPWFESLTASGLEDGHEMILACVVDENRVKAILPLMKSTGNGKAWYSLKHGFTPLYSLLLAEDDQDKVLSCLARAFSQLPVKGLLLEPVAKDDGRLNDLQEALVTAGFSCDHTFRDYNWIYHLEGRSYEEYMAERPAHLRNTITRKKRKLEREHDCDLRLYTGNEVPGHMPEFYNVYNASWKQNELGNAGFLDHFIGRFSKAGWSRLGILYVTGQPVAAQLWFVHGGKASIFRLAYDRKWKQYSPGSILTSYLMEHVINVDKVDTIDYLTGNDAYKQDWMSERRERFMLACIKKGKPASEYNWFTRFLKSRRRELLKSRQNIR